jgi:hypothetical protein
MKQTKEIKEILDEIESQAVGHILDGDSAALHMVDGKTYEVIDHLSLLALWNAITQDKKLVSVLCYEIDDKGFRAKAGDWFLTFPLSRVAHIEWSEDFRIEMKAEKRRIDELHNEIQGHIEAQRVEEEAI